MKTLGDHILDLVKSMEDQKLGKSKAFELYSICRFSGANELSFSTDLKISDLFLINCDSLVREFRFTQELPQTLSGISTRFTALTPYSKDEVFI